MVLRLVVIAWLGCLAVAGPMPWDDSKCAQECKGGAKYQYSEGTSYIYSFESSNTLEAPGATDLSMKMTATVKLTAVSKCEMVLQVLDATLQHGPVQETSSPFIDALKKNPFPFSFDDGKINHVCPNPDDPNDVNNVKKAIVSAFQNSMKSFEANLYEKEVDVLGSCDTEYRTKMNQNDKFVFLKLKDISTCTDHIKGQTLLLAQLYESSSKRQHLPFLSGETLTCQQTVVSGIVEEVSCSEEASFKPLYEFGYVVNANGVIKLKKISTETSSGVAYRAPKKESLAFKYNPTVRKNENLEAEAQNTLRHICENSEGLITKNARNSVHKLVYLIRGLSLSPLEKLYESLKNKQLCASNKALTIYLDALKAASSGASISLFSKLVAKGEIRKTDAFLWMTLLPFTSYLDEESVAATLPLLKKDTAIRQSLLGVSAMTYKYCSTRNDCENSNAVKSVSSSLKQFLGDKCQTTNKEEEAKIMTALKAFGNLGYIGDSADSIFECANLNTNEMTVRVAAIEAFRRTPCSEKIASQLLDIFKNKNEDDEVRIASLVALSKCANKEIFRHILETYSSESSQQVKVFTWSLLTNMQSSSDPVKSSLTESVYLEEIEVPDSTDLTKFSRNFQLSLFSEFLNIGNEFDGNLIYSKNSFLPRSSSIGIKSNIFGNQLDLFQIGSRIEDLEHILEKLFGPHGLMPNLNVDDLLNLIPVTRGKRRKRSTESYKSKIEALSERMGYSRGKIPHGSAYFRVLGHELAWVNLHKDMFKKFGDISLDDILKEITSTKVIDVAKNLLFLDVTALFPSVTGRAYKLAGNGSLTLGLKTDGKIDIEKPNFPNAKVHVEGMAQPSLLSDLSASFTIHSEDFEPGVKVETVVSAGLDVSGKFELKDFRLLHIKLDRRQDRQEILSLKRTIYVMNHAGTREIPKIPSYNLNYCTKYLQTILGAQYCLAATIPHIFDAEGKPKIPFVRSMEASVVVEKTDKSMEGYEILLELPEYGARKERKYKFLLDTPNSAINRKFSIDLIAKRPNTESTEIALNVVNPFYSLDIGVDVLNKADVFQLKAEALGDKKRRYAILMDVKTNARGSRLIEYQPTVDIILHKVRPIQLSGTIVFSKGLKEQISINMQSQSFDSPLTIKGNLAKEGANIALEENWKLQSFFNVTAFEQIHRMESIFGNQEGKGLYLDLGHHYEPDGRSYESVSLNAKLENIELRDRLQFSLETNLILAEHEEISSNLRWDFSLKPFAHLKNDIIFRYGKNFEDNKHLVRVTQMTALNGDFETYEHMDIENKLGLTISCFDFDKYGALSFGWNFEKKPKLFFEIGVRTEKDREISLKYDYQHLTTKPLKIAAEGKIVYYTYTFLYKDQLHEIAPNEYQGKAVIIPREGKEITVDYIHKIKSQNNFHHEFDGTVNLPGTVVPVHIKADLALNSDSLKLNTIADTGNRRSYSIDMNLQKTGASDIKLFTPLVEGTVNVNSENGDHSVRADIKAVETNRRIIVTGNIAENDVKTLTLEVQLDADNDAEKKLSIKATTSKEVEDGIDKHMITAAIIYEGAINVDVKGKISTDLIRGPHYFRADFSGNMGPMAIEYTHQIKHGEVESVMKYLRSDSEKLRLDMKGKYVFTATKFLTEYGLFLSSPYKTFDGKELYFQIMGDSSETKTIFIAEYRIKPATVIGYVGKIDYERKKGWPGQIRSNLLVTVHQRPLYEGSTHIDYGNGKYSWKTSFTPISKRKINLFTSFEHAAKFAAFHHSMSAQLQYLQNIQLNAVADLRNMEDAKVHSNLGVNNHELYNLNSTLKMRSLIDFEGHLVLFSKITPSLHVLYKTQSSGQVTKYDMNLEVDSVNIITGSGELKKRKRGFNGDMIFNYREREFLVLNINQEAKSKQERFYVVKLKTPWRSYEANVKIIKEKKGSVRYETKFCRNEAEKCILIDAYHKEPGEFDEWQISYKRGDVDFSIERITSSTNDLSRFHTVIYKGDKRYGYDLRLAKEGKGHSISLGIILPSREIVTKTYGEISLQKPRVKFEFSADARKHPERKLITDIRFENHLTDNNPSKLNVIISHPIYEKPIELQLIADLEPTSNKILTAEMSADYSNNPEDKLIGKLTLFVESKDGNSETMILNIFHKDEEHLDLVLKINGSETDNEDFVGIFWNWKDEGDVDMEAFLYYRYLKKERKFYFEYNRPKLVYQLDGSVVTPQTLLLDNTCEVDLKSVYNGEITKAKYIVDYANNCHRLLVFNVEGQKTQVIELCFSRASRKLLSIWSESLDEEGEWTFDFSVDIIRKSWRTIKIMSNFNLEFLGATLFKATSLGDELSAAGVGTLPFYNSPRFKLIRNAFHSKIFQPSVRFFIPEAARFIADVKRDTTFAAIKLKEYYNSLPPLTEVQETIEKISEWIESFLLEVWKAVESYYKQHLKKVINFVDKATGIVKAICNNNEDCRAFVKAYNDGGWKGLANQIQNFLKSLPQRVRNFMERPGVDARKFFDKVMVLVKTVLQPLTKYKCGEIVVKSVQLIYQKLEPHIQNFLENYPNFYRAARQAIVTNEYVILSTQIAKESYSWVKEEVLKIDYEKLFAISKKYVEELLFNFTPPSPKSSFTVHTLQHGKVDFDIHFGVSQSYPLKIILGILDRITNLIEKFFTNRAQFGSNALLVKFKKGADLNFFPPYEAQAMIMNNQHFITFDKLFYDFSGECVYLLTRDFEDGNFTFALSPAEAGKDPSILALINNLSVEINSGDKTVKISDNPVELPYISNDFNIERSGSNSIMFDDKRGAKFKCNLEHSLCSFTIAGWYFGKTAGLLGTYNYEKSDEFKRPKGQIANSPTVHAKSWELKKGCKTSNLISDVKINENSEYYKSCKKYFKDTSSPLAACFNEVKPDQYFELCLRHLAKVSDQSKAICNIATAYVMECERNYVELSLPSACITCIAPDGTPLQHGDRKKYENLSKKAADMSFGVVGYGGDIGNPQVYTVKGDIFFNARDIGTIKDRLKVVSQKNESSRAFEAMKLAVTYSFRSDTAKSFVLLSCSACKYDFKSLLYPVIQQSLLERGITLHVISNAEITIRKSSVKEKGII
ncbi:apolipophorins, partial [Trichonephila clavata]